MKSMFLALALALPLAAAPAAEAGDARAKDEGAEKAPKKEPKKKKKVKRYDFDGDNIEGDGILPSGDRIFTLDPFDHGSLIKVRTTFRRQVLRTAEETR